MAGRSGSWVAAWALGALLVLASTPAAAIGEPILDVRVRDNVRTAEDTIRSIAGLTIGETLELGTLETVRERLSNTGLFADVNVYWEPYRYGVRVNIVIKDKFPWAPVPTFAYSSGNVSGGLVVVHGNLFGRGKRGLVGGRVSTVDSGGLVAYEDPAILGSWAYFQVRGKFQDQIIPEYGNAPGLLPLPLRESKLRTWGGSAAFGVAWFRRVKTAVAWNVERIEVLDSRVNPDYLGAPPSLPWAADGGRRALLETTLTFDFRVRDHAILYGNALSFSLDHASARWLGDDTFDYWKAHVAYEHGLRIGRRQNLVVRLGATAGRDLPLWSENSAGGHNLRGFRHRQFSGDTHLRSQIEYHMPLFSIAKLDVRGLLFNDAAAIWFRELPTTDQTGSTYDRRPDGRQFLPTSYLVPGFVGDRDVRTSFGAGLRFFLKSLAVPLVGADFGYGLGEDTWRLVLVLGA